MNWEVQLNVVTTGLLAGAAPVYAMLLRLLGAE